MSDPHVEDEMPVLSRELPNREKPKDLPRSIQWEIRKFALEQAVNSLPHLRPGVLTLDVAKQFESYILNGRAKNE